MRKVTAYGSATFLLRDDQRTSWFQCVRGGDFDPGFPIKLQTFQRGDGLRVGYVSDSRAPGVDLPPEVEKERKERLRDEAFEATRQLPGVTAPGSET